MAAADPRSRTRCLSGYLCGTHSGLMARRGRAVAASAVLAEVAAHHEVATDAGQRIGDRGWAGEAAPALRDALSDALADEAVVDLVVYGSHARGTTTGFSDLDALLVLDHGAVRSRSRLARLRRRVLAAQRAVIAHQPAQHHGFDVVLDADLVDAPAATGLPRETLVESRSLFGRGAAAGFGPAAPTAPAAAGLEQIARTLLALRRWPAHPWDVHRIVSMFELVPALVVQAGGRSCTKAASFELVRELTGDPWEPYAQLEQVRARWPRTEHRGLRQLMRATRNPWAAVAAVRRFPATLSPAVAPLLGPALLGDLQALLRRAAA